MKPLSDKQEKFVRGVASGLDPRQAALRAGYSESMSRQAGRLARNPEVREALAEIRKAGREAAAYSLVDAMRECAEAITFAKKHRNAMAYAKLVELRSKLSGLLVEKIEVSNVDLRGALDLAKQRAATRIINASRIGESDQGDEHAGSA